MASSRRNGTQLRVREFSLTVSSVVDPDKQSSITRVPLCKTSVLNNYKVHTREQKKIFLGGA